MCSDSQRRSSRKGYRSKAFPGKSTIFGMAELDSSENSGKADLGLETWALTEQDIDNIQPEECGSLTTDKTKGHKLSINFKTRVGMVGKDKSSPTGSARHQRLKSCGQKNHTTQKSE